MDQYTCNLALIRVEPVCLQVRVHISLFVRLGFFLETPAAQDGCFTLISAMLDDPIYAGVTGRGDK